MKQIAQCYSECGSEYSTNLTPNSGHCKKMAKSLHYFLSQNKACFGKDYEDNCKI